MYSYFIQGAQDVGKTTLIEKIATKIIAGKIIPVIIT